LFNLAGNEVIEFLGITLIGAVVIGLLKMAKRDVKDALQTYYDEMGGDK
jgi:hypothetical protein